MIKIELDSHNLHEICIKIRLTFENEWNPQAADCVNEQFRRKVSGQVSGAMHHVVVTNQSPGDR